jgi:hypothetical protein
MRRNPAIVFTMALALSAATLAQSTPDFSGTWTMDATRSASAVQNEPIGPVTVVIAQSPAELRITTTQGQKTTVEVIRLDGAESKVPGGTAKARWEGSTLVVESVRDIQGASVTTKQARTLAAGGSEMTVDAVLEVQHGYTLNTKGTKNYGTGQDVYVRVRQ